MDRPTPFPLVVADDRFATHFETFLRKFRETANDGGDGTTRWEPNTTRRRVFATKDTMNDDRRAIVLRSRVADVYREVFGEYPPRDARFSVSFVYEPKTNVERKEYDLMNVVLCSEPGMRVLDQTGVWRSITPEEGRRGVAISGALHPVYSATRYRLSRPVTSFLMFSVEPPHAHAYTRVYYHVTRALRDSDVVVVDDTDVTDDPRESFYV